MVRLGDNGAGSRTYASVVTDHLGSTRAEVTGATQWKAFSYWPNGELVTMPSAPIGPHMFTAHEREELGASGGVMGGLDYMHERYYSLSHARFVSFDPVDGSIGISQSWNSFGYLWGSPTVFVDPFGEKISLAALSEDERSRLVSSLNRFTGNTYAVDDDKNLILVETAEGNSKTATDALNEAIASDEVLSVIAKNGTFFNFGGGSFDDKTIVIDFEDFEKISYGDINPESFSLGSHFMHEFGHAWKNMDDPPQGSEFGQTVK